MTNTAHIHAQCPEPEDINKVHSHALSEYALWPGDKYKGGLLDLKSNHYKNSKAKDPVFDLSAQSIPQQRLEFFPVVLSALDLAGQMLLSFSSKV